jgi:predicted ABC-type ATPase
MADPQHQRPRVFIISGPNGAGKSTSAPVLLALTDRPLHFVNADVIAQGLSAFRPESQAINAGRIMLNRLRELAAGREDFAFETTLASRTFAPWIAELEQQGYSFSLIFLCLMSADEAVTRVGTRVRAGGHHVPEADVRRRYERGLWNLFNVYLPLADRWLVYDGGVEAGRRLIAAGIRDAAPVVADHPTWDRLREQYDERQQ